MKTDECCCFRQIKVVNRDNRANIGYIVYTRKLAETKGVVVSRTYNITLNLVSPRARP